jgi:hypothetical protein
MKREHDPQRWKTEAADLIGLLHAQGFTSAALLAELLAISERYALYILTDLQLHQPRKKITAAEALEACSADLSVWVIEFRNGKRRTDSARIAA